MQRKYRTIPLSDEEFAALYPTTPNPELARMLGVSVVTLTRRAKRLGVHKDGSVRYAHFRQPLTPEHRAKIGAAHKGRVFSEESRAKMSASRKGRVITPEWRAKISASNKGKPRPSNEQRRGVPLSEAHRAAISRGNKAYRARAAKGGIRPKPFGRYTPEYRAWRKTCLLRDGYTCQDCGRVFVPGQRGVNVHHVRPYAKYEAVRLAPGNGVTMCTACHRRHHACVPLTDYERIEQVPCGCGCGQMMYPIDADGRPRRYVRGHNMRGSTKSPETRRKISESLMGRPLGPFTREHRQRISENRAGKGLGKTPPMKGWQNTYMTQEEFVAAYAAMTSTEIAAYCHVSQACVTKWAKRIGLAPRYGAGGTGLLKPRRTT